MSITRIATRYAKALLTLATERNEVEAVHQDMQQLQKATQNRDLHLLLKGPVCSIEKKKSIIRALFEGKVSQLTLLYLDFLIDKGRAAYIAEIAEEVVQQYKALKRITSVRLVSAVPLSETTVALIKQKILQSGLTTENVEITTAVDPSLIGGFILEFEDKRYNAAVSRRLAELKAGFIKNHYLREF